MSSRAKALVKKWKQLIPEAEGAQQRHVASPEVRSRLETMPEPSGFRAEGYDTKIEPREGHGSRMEPSRSKMESNDGHGSRMELKEGHRSRKELQEGCGRGLRMEGHGSRIEKRGTDGSLSQRPASQHSGSITDPVKRLAEDGSTVGNGRLVGDGRSKSREGKCRTSRAGAPIICIDSGDSEDSVVEVTRTTMPSQEQKKRNKDKKRRKSRERHESNLNECDVTGNHRELHPLSRDSRSQGVPEQSDVMVVGQNYAASVVASQVKRERSPVVAAAASVGMKRKGECVEYGWAVCMTCPLPAVESQQEVGIAQTKRSRTQVYSGKRTQTGPQG